ncbi:MAG: hypothetical protein WAV22_07240 [Porticoccaceae bacterium]
MTLAPAAAGIQNALIYLDVRVRGSDDDVVVRGSAHPPPGDGGGAISMGQEFGDDVGATLEAGLGALFRAIAAS